MHVRNFPCFKQNAEHSKHFPNKAKGGISFLGDFWEVFGEDLGTKAIDRDYLKSIKIGSD